MKGAKWFKIMRATAARLSVLLAMATVVVWIDSRWTTTQLRHFSLEPPEARRLVLTRGRVLISHTWPGTGDTRSLRQDLARDHGWHWDRVPATGKGWEWTYQVAHTSEPTREDWHFLGLQFGDWPRASLQAGRQLFIPCSWLLVLFSILPVLECRRLIILARQRRQRGFAVLQRTTDD